MNRNTATMRTTGARLSAAALLGAALLLSGARATAQPDTIKKIRDSGAITMGVRDASGAMSFTLGPGKYAGFHVEICERVIDDLKKSLQLDRLDVHYQLVTPQNRIPLMNNGTVDIECGTTSNTLVRQKEVAFAPTLFVEGVRIAVKADSAIGSPAQLSGKTVAATTGSTSVPITRKLKRDAAPQLNEILAKDNSEGFLLLESGRADAFIADGQILATFISKAKEPAQYRLLDQVLSTEPIAIMLPRDDPAFKKLVDQSIVQLAKTGAVAQIYDKWFMQPIPPNNARVALPPNAMTRAAWANPNDRAMEEYEAR